MFARFLSRYPWMAPKRAVAWGAFVMGLSLGLGLGYLWGLDTATYTHSEPFGGLPVIVLVGAFILGAYLMGRGFSIPEKPDDD